MGLMLSIVISYAGINEAIECVKHIIRGVVPDGEPNFQELVEYYTRLHNKSANPSSPGEWIKECGQGYLSLTEDKNGSLQSATVKYYGQTRSTAILFSTKISSFGQESVDEGAQINGDYRTDRYTPTKTKTIISKSLESFSIGPRNKLSTPQNTLEAADDSNENDNELNDLTEDKEKLSWHYKPKSPSRKPLPEIHFQSYDADRVENTAYSEEFLRSLDGIKFRPLQRNDPSGRRRSFRKRHSSSSNSSKDSRASRDEELKMFTSLEEEEFRKMNESDKGGRFGSTPNLPTRSYSRSRSREKSREGSERWSTEASVDSAPDEAKPRLIDLPKLDSFAEERDDSKETNEVTEETEEEVDFWANFGD